MYREALLQYADLPRVSSGDHSKRSPVIKTAGTPETSQKALLIIERNFSEESVSGGDEGLQLPRLDPREMTQDKWEWNSVYET